MDTPFRRADLDDPITGHMRQGIPRLGIGLTVGQALDWLRAHPPEGRIVYFYVVDGEGRLKGVVPTRRLVLGAPERPIAEILIGKVVAVPAAATVLDACELFIQHRLLALPVVDERGVLLGVVDMELYTDELANLGDAQVRDDLFQLIGVHVTRGQVQSPLVAFRRRFPWLGCNLAAGILAAFLAGMYQDALDRVVALAFFIPVVLNLAESVSSQSVSLTLQMLHGERPTWKALFRNLRGELGTGLLLGLGSGAIIGLVALVWLGQARVALCLLGAITGGVAWAAVLGISLPIMLRMLHLEPRVAAGPIALAAVDVVTILLYLNLARWLLT
jgi:magnesium transporter